MQYEHIATQELTSPASSISFQNIDTIYRFFRLTAWVLKDATLNNWYVQFNGDTGNNYITQGLTASSTSVTAARSTATLAWYPWDATAFAPDASEPAFNELLIGKSVAGEEARMSSVAIIIDTNEILAVTGGEWSNTADLINRIDIVSASGNLDTGTRIILEGARVENA